MRPLFIALGEVLQGQLPAAGRSAMDVVKDTVKAPIDFTRTALSGTMGLFQTTGDEVAYLVDAKGYKISAINPKEHVTIAFGCAGEQTIFPRKKEGAFCGTFFLLS